MMVRNIAYAISKGIGYTDLMAMPILAYRALLEAWRDEDDYQLKRQARVAFIAKGYDGKQLEQSLEELWPQHRANSN